MQNRKSKKLLILSEGNKLSGPSTWKSSLLLNVQKEGWQVEEVNTNSPVSLLKILNVGSITAVHGYHVAGFTIAFIIFARILRKKVIYTIHGDIKAEQEIKTGLKRILWIPLHIIIFRFAHKLTFPSRFIFNKVVMSYPAVQSKSVIIPNGIDIKAVPIRNVTSQYQLLSITNFNYPKKAAGVVPLIEAVNSLVTLYPAIRLTILGGGRDFEEYKSKYSGEHVSFRGFQKPGLFFEQAALFIHSTFLDNMPYAILEAMSYGIPVITVPTGAIPEMITSESIVEPTSTGLRNKISELIEHPEQQKNIALKNSAILDNFRWETVVHDFTKLYQA